MIKKYIIVNKMIKFKLNLGNLIKNTLSISGHRLGRFNGDLRKVTKYLNDSTSDIISVFNPKKIQINIFMLWQAYQKKY